jgi:undecaprenyl-phosphate 4-deoxy-4-formamido-L-arabinose transferase
LIAYLAAAIIVPGYASTITAILVLGGVQLMALGIIGEYLGRLHLNVNRKPQYTIRTVVANPDEVQDSESSAAPASNC